mmetsp:Transcript_33227/g.38701  ORF Transcript_33227/g.38701 Transcript_33227/m.38701 type:complete len:94 (-) Transcript_33227:282-563(-)
MFNFDVQFLYFFTDLVLHPETSEDDARVTFVSDTPYGNTSSQVFEFKEKGVAIGSARGLPGCAAPQTIIGWVKRVTDTRYATGCVLFNFHSHT